jgi:hypothetical protein
VTLFSLLDTLAFTCKHGATLLRSRSEERHGIFIFVRGKICFLFRWMANVRGTDFALPWPAQGGQRQGFLEIENRLHQRLF